MSVLRAKPRSFLKFPFHLGWIRVRALLVSSSFAPAMSLSGWNCQQICCFHFHSCRTIFQKLMKIECMPLDSFSVAGWGRGTAYECLSFTKEIFQDGGRWLALPHNGLCGPSHLHSHQLLKMGNLLLKNEDSHVLVKKKIQKICQPWVCISIWSQLAINSHDFLSMPLSVLAHSWAPQEAAAQRG